ncbi:hypothetical protein P8C59_000650 [Phyllachora maydis]|uniref:J domain-containing protein n=1 Tax=Phyllachora maydis TaxID=1825666 RepID=A0AAD9M946_9PEZI|nr:hypothetical protein P8C59_000650 [Phyllachora maydis]
MDDIVAHAKDLASKGEDLYAKFNIANARDIRDEELFTGQVSRAWRKTALKYHPDKTGDKYDEALYRSFERARDVLLDPAARRVYDDTINAAQWQKQQRDKMSAQKRQLLDDLERREREGREKMAETHGAISVLSLAELAERNAMRERGRKLAEERARLIREAEERDRRRALAAQGPPDTRQASTSTDSGIPADTDYDAKEAELMRRIAQRKAEKEQRKAEKKTRKSGAFPASPFYVEDTQEKTGESKPSQSSTSAAKADASKLKDQHVTKTAGPTEATEESTGSKKDFTPLMERLRAAQAKKVEAKRLKEAAQKDQAQS